jgi:hypothetical protein
VPQPRQQPQGAQLPRQPGSPREPGNERRSIVHKGVEKAFFENSWNVFSGLVFVIGVVLGSVGGACIDDTLVGVDECYTVRASWGG